MLTRRSTTAARTKMLLFIPVVLVCMLCSSKNVFSQGKTWKSNVYVTLANVPDTSWHANIKSYEPIISNPQLVCSEPSGEITRFTVSFQPKGKDFAGPFVTTGSKLTNNPMVVTWLEKLKASGTEKVRMYIEEIHVTYKGEDLTARPIILTITPNNDHSK